jgi:hypothetical protein
MRWAPTRRLAKEPALEESLVHAPSWIGRLLLPAALLLCLSVASPLRADEDERKGKQKEKVKKTDADVEKIAQEVTRRVLAELRGEEKKEKKEKKEDKPTKKGEKQGRVITIDLDKLPPDLAKQVLKYAGGKKGEKKKGEEKETRKKGKKKEKDEDEDEDKKKSKKKKEKDD